jgi:hypothetical protein
MKYALLIYGDESGRDAVGDEERQMVYKEYDTFAQEAVQRGLMRGGEELKDTSSATTVRVRDGEILVTDGPFAETKEQLGGLFLLECKDADEAIEMAAKIPGARSGSIEVRPCVEQHTEATHQG